MTSETTEKFDAKQMLKEVARLLNRAKVPLSDSYREQYGEAMSDVTADLNLLIGSINELKQIEDEIETLEYKKAKKIQEIREDLKDSESTYPQIYSILRGEMEQENQGELPQELQSNRAKGMLDRAVEEGLLKEDYQPCSDTKKWQLACLADCMGDALDLNNKWIVFGSLWGSGSNLRKYKGDKQGLSDYTNFEKKIKRSII